MNKIIQITNFKTAMIVLFFVFISSINCFGINSRGSNIRYEYISGKQYRIILTAIHDCRGIPYPDSMTMTMFTDASCTSNTSFTVKRTAIKNVTLQCASGTSCVGGSKGYEANIYTKIIDFDSLPYKNVITNACCKVYFSWSGCCRASGTGGINTFSNLSSIYNYAMLDVCKGAGNTAAEYTNLPIASAFCNTDFFYNSGVIDANGDSLVFSLESPLGSSRTDSAIFNSPLHSKIPISPTCLTAGVTCPPAYFGSVVLGFGFNTTNGDMRLTPSNCSEVTSFVIRTDEYKKDTNGVYQLVGFSRRDQYLEMYPSSGNFPPSIPDMSCQYACAGQQFSMTINSKDPKPTVGSSDTTFLAWNNGIPNATFKILDSSAKEKSAQITWTPSRSDIRERPYYFNVSVTESFCGSTMQASKAGCIIVVDTLKSTYVLKDKLNGTLIVDANGSGGLPSLPITYRWVVDTNINFLNGKTLVNQKDSLQRLNPGKYYVQLFVENGSNCSKTYLDSINITPYFRFNFKGVYDSSCHGKNLLIKPNILDGKRPIAYEWYVSGNATQISSDSILNFNVTKTETLFLSATDANNQNYSLEFKVNHIAGPDFFSVKNPAPKCANDGKFDLLAGAPLGIGLNSSEVDSNAIWFTMVDIKRDTMVKKGIVSPHYYYSDRFYNTNMNGFIPPNGVDKVTIHARHHRTGCEDSTIFDVKIFKNPVITLKNRMICQSGGSVKVNASLISPDMAQLNSGTYTWKIDSAPNAITTFDIGQILVNEGNTANPDYVFYSLNSAFEANQPENTKRVGKYKLKFCFLDSATACSSCDSMYITILTPPAINFTAFGKICYNTDTVKLNSYVNLFNGRWELISFNGQKSGVEYNKAVARMPDSVSVIVNQMPGEYYWRYVNATQACVARDSIKLNVIPEPFVKITSEKGATIYLGETTNLKSTPTSNILWENSSIDSIRNIREFAYSAGIHAFSIRYIDPVTNCIGRDTIELLIVKEKRPISVQTVLEKGLNYFPNPAKNLVEITAEHSFNSLKLIDIFGKTVQFQSFGNALNYKLDLENIASGVYFILLDGENGSAKLRLEVRK